MATTRKMAWLACVCLVLSATPLALRVAGAAAGSGGAPVDGLARDVERAEAVRAVKDLQHAYSQYAQYGLWTDLGSLFTESGEAIYGDEVVKGRTAIATYHTTKYGGGKPGLPPGVVNSWFVEVPIVNLSVDGMSAKARWYGFNMLGGTATARWDSGTLQNEYVKDDGVWKIARLHYYPQFGGPYESGWEAYTNPLPSCPITSRTRTRRERPSPRRSASRHQRRRHSRISKNASSA